MVKTKLKKYKEFVAQLLPHEALFLERFDAFQDAEKKQIFELTIKQAKQVQKTNPFNELIDKRKYYFVKKWITKKLEQQDVDIKTQWILDLRSSILLDRIKPEEEVTFLHYIESYQTIDFSFQPLFELAQEYKTYLLIRMRYRDHEKVALFLDTFSNAFIKAKKINAKLYEATIEITQQYAVQKTNTRYWERWLKKVFTSTQIDGSNRYRAFILLAFMYTNYGDNARLKEIFDAIDVYFSQGQMYSRRLLCNYYNSRVLLHSKINEFETAIFYGYKSLLHQNDDTLMYLNNVVGILTRMKRFQEAFTLLESNQLAFQQTQNIHHKTSFVSFQVRVLMGLNKFQLAEDKARNFLQKYEDIIFKHRWHHFFTSYLNVLLIQEKYEEIVRLSFKYQLLELESKRKHLSSYVPNVAWTVRLAQYMEGQISEKKLLSSVFTSVEGIQMNLHKQQLLSEILVLFSEQQPTVFAKLKSHLAKNDVFYL